VKLGRKTRFKISLFFSIILFFVGLFSLIYNLYYRKAGMDTNSWTFLIVMIVAVLATIQDVKKYKQRME
jgi:hypothetical protein